jgi:Tfp pilus assembly protein PilF
VKQARGQIAGTAVLLVVALTFVYWNHFDNGFHFDDKHTIVDNRYVTDITKLPLFFKDAKTASSLPTNQAYRPMITSLNAIDFWLAGELDPRVYHWHIYLEFLLLLSLMYLLMTRVFAAASGDPHPFLALFACALFAFHTATAETVNYIIARSDGFSTLLVLAGMLLYTGNRGWKKQLGLIPFIIGCLAKPTTLMLAPLLLVHDLLLEHPSLTVQAERPNFAAKLTGSLKSTSGYFLVGAGMYLFTRSMFSDTWTPSNASALQYLNTQPFIMWVYLKTFVLPTGLSADTDLGLIKDYLSPKVLWGLLVVAVMLLLAWLAARKRKTLPASFGILWFFIALIPTSSIIPLAEVMNHHRTFFPYIGLVMAASWSAWLLFGKIAGAKPSLPVRTVAVLLAGAVLAAHAWGTHQRNEVWDSDWSLWRDVAAKSPLNGRGLMNYGLAEMRRGDSQTALEYFEKALNTNYGRHPYLYTNLGIATNSLGDTTRAESYFIQAVRMGPGFPEVHYYYARWLNQNGRPEEAIQRLEKALELSPAHQPAGLLMQEIRQSAQDAVSAAAARAAAADTPEAWLDLSLEYYKAGQYEPSIEASRKSLRLRPDYAEAYNNICAARNRMEQYELAIEACENALAIRPDYQLALGNLNWARNALNKSR